MELIGEFEDSGFKEAPYIARRSDGQVVQMPAMLYALAAEVDGRRGYDEIAESYSHRIQRGVTGEMVEMLIDEKLRPLGVIAPEHGEHQELNKVDPLLALKFRARLVPQPVVSAITRVFNPLFHAPVVALVVAGFAATLVWLFGFHGISQGLRHVIYQPALLLMLLGGVVLATAFHEIGHATACRFGGAKPGVMGAGVYIVWPAFYTDITDAYRLDKKGRLRTDLGGMYFNAVFALVVLGAYAVTGFEPLILLIVLQSFTVVQQSLPFLRLDGYYVISDLTGVPDILLRMRSILTSVLPWRKPDDKVTELKPWVRVVVTAYLLVLVPVIGLMFLLMLIHAPRVFATGWDSFWVHYDRVGPRFDQGQTALGLTSVFQMALLALPAAGIVYTATRVFGRFGSVGWGWSAGNPLRRALLTSAVAAGIGVLTYLWWPNGDYKPIQPGERGTLAGAVKGLRDLPSGRPALPVERELQLGGAPSERQLQREGRERVRGDESSVPTDENGNPSTTGEQPPAGGRDGATGAQPGSADPLPQQGQRPGTATPPPGTPQQQSGTAAPQQGTTPPPSQPQQQATPQDAPPQTTTTPPAEPPPTTPEQGTTTTTTPTSP
jgi:putative peptide zinc metalloprotease protein